MILAVAKKWSATFGASQRNYYFRMTPAEIETFQNPDLVLPGPSVSAMLSIPMMEETYNYYEEMLSKALSNAFDNSDTSLHLLPVDGETFAYFFCSEVARLCLKKFCQYTQSNSFGSARTSFAKRASKSEVLPGTIADISLKMIKLDKKEMPNFKLSKPDNANNENLPKKLRKKKKISSI